VRAAIETRLREQRILSMDNMTLQLESVQFSGDTAGREMRFQSDHQPEAAVSVHYRLRRIGDRWDGACSPAMRGKAGNPHGSASL